MRKIPPDWALGLLLILGIYLWQRTALPMWMVDLFHIQFAAYEWKTGESQWMYTSYKDFNKFIEHREPIARTLEMKGDSNTYFYPPFLAGMLSPVADCSAIIWRNTLFAINVVLLFVFAYQTVKLCEVELSWRAILWALALVLVTYPMARAAMLGQIVPLLSAAMWAGLLAMRKAKAVSSGILLAAVSALKMFPLGMIVLPVLTGRKQVVYIWLGGIAGIYAISLLWMGIDIHLIWWNAVREFGSVVYVFFGNQAPSGWFGRLAFDGNIQTLYIPNNTLTTIFRLAGDIVFGGTTLFVLYRCRRLIDSQFAASSGLLMSGILLALPVSWEHYWMFVFPCVGWAVYTVWFGGDKRFWEAWLALAVFFFTMKLTRFYGDDTFGRFASGSQLFGMLMLWIWFLRRLWNEFTLVKT